MVNHSASTGDDPRVEAARRLVRHADTVERLRGWGGLTSVLAVASFVATAGVASPAWVVVPLATALAGGCLFLWYARIRRQYHREFAAAGDQFALPAAARNDPRRYFDSHHVDHGVPRSHDPVVGLLTRGYAGPVALVVLGLAVLIRFVI